MEQLTTYEEVAEYVEYGLEFDNRKADYRIIDEKFYVWSTHEDAYQDSQGNWWIDGRVVWDEINQICEELGITDAA